MTSAPPIVVRLFEPTTLLFPEGAMPAFDATIPSPNCLLCEGPASPPSRMGWLETPERQAVFVCCGACSDCDDKELERRIVANVSNPVAAAAASRHPPRDGRRNPGRPQTASRRRSGGSTLATISAPSCSRRRPASSSAARSQASSAAAFRPRTSDTCGDPRRPRRRGHPGAGERTVTELDGVEHRVESPAATLRAPAVHRLENFRPHANVKQLHPLVRGFQNSRIVPRSTSAGACGRHPALSPP